MSREAGRTRASRWAGGEVVRDAYVSGGSRHAGRAQPPRATRHTLCRRTPRVRARIANPGLSKIAISSCFCTASQSVSLPTYIAVAAESNRQRTLHRSKKSKLSGPSNLRNSVALTHSIDSKPNAVVCSGGQVKLEHVEDAAGIVSFGGYASDEEELELVDAEDLERAAGPSTKGRTTGQVCVPFCVFHKFTDVPGYREW